MASWTIVCVALLLCSLPNHAGPSKSVISIDLGSQWVKVGIVSSGSVLEVVLNRESKRKTPVAVAFRNDGREHLIGEDALALHARQPEASFLFFTELLGQTLNSSAVNKFKERFPYYNLKEDPVTGGPLFYVTENLQFSTEELVAMILREAGNQASVFADLKEPIRNVIITVPPFFGDAERRALIRAADLSGLNLTQLLNSNTAAALNYGVQFRKELENKSSGQSILMYDMGATSAVATVVHFEKVWVELNQVPQLSVHGVGYNRELGGADFTALLRDYLADAFEKKEGLNVRDNPRAMGKLWKEAERVKIVLSANSDHLAQVEGLMAEKDLRMAVTRNELESLGENVLSRVTGPAERALEMAGMSKDEVDQVVLVGAATRIPKVQEILKDYFGKDLSRSLNTDEAIAMGAVYKGAELTPGVRVKKFLTKDGILRPVLVEFMTLSSKDPDGLMTEGRLVQKTLFHTMDAFPSRKVMTFSNRFRDFELTILRPMSSLESDGGYEEAVSRIRVKGLTEAFQQLSKEVDTKGVRVHFALDENGILSATRAELKLATTLSEEVMAALSTIGSAVSNFFGGGDDQENRSDPKAAGNKSRKSGEELRRDEVRLVLEMVGRSEPGKQQMEERKQRLDELEEAERLRRQVESAIHSLESYILELQERAEASASQGCLKEEAKTKILNLASKTSDWLYEEGFSAVEPSMIMSKDKLLRRKAGQTLEEAEAHCEESEERSILEKLLQNVRDFQEEVLKMEDLKISADGGLMDELANAGKDAEKWLQKNLAMTEEQGGRSSKQLKQVKEIRAKLERAFTKAMTAVEKAKTDAGLGGASKQKAKRKKEEL